MTELETTIRDLVRRLNAAREGSAERRFIERQLIGLRDDSELGGLIIEGLVYYEKLSLPDVIT